MSETKHLCDLWEHTIVKILKHDPKSQVTLMINEWVVFNKLENFNSLLNYIMDDFTPSGNLCCHKEKGEILHQTPLEELFNLRWYNRKISMIFPLVSCCISCVNNTSSS